MASPFFNVNEQVSAFLEILLENKEAPSEKALFSKLFGKKPFNHQKLRYVMTDLTRLLEQFLSYSGFQKDDSLQKQLLMKRLHTDKHEKYFFQNASFVKNYKSNTPVTIKQLKDDFEHDELICEFNRRISGRTFDDSLARVSESLDVYYFSQRLKYACELLNRKNVLNENYESGILDFISNALKNPLLESNPVIAVYHRIFLLLQDYDNEKLYLQLKNKVKEVQQVIHRDELRDIYVFLQNFCIRKINNSDESYPEELFSLYKEMIINEIIFENNELEHHHFKNIVTLALRLNELVWTENFIQEQQLKLNKDLRKNAVSYNTARILYARKKYREALRIMRTVEFTDIYYHLDSKVLLLKIYFETEDFEPLLSLVTTTNTYLRRSKLISPYQRTIYINLLKYIRKLSKYKAGEKISLQQLKHNFAVQKDIADVTWLKAKFAELG